MTRWDGIFLAWLPGDGGVDIFENQDQASIQNERSTRGLEQADRNDRFRAEPRDEKRVTHREDGLPRHLENHGHREKSDGSVEASFSEILLRTVERFDDGVPDAFSRSAVVRRGVDHARIEAQRVETKRRFDTVVILPRRSTRRRPVPNPARVP